jgi:hypothetical protein
VSLWFPSSGQVFFALGLIQMKAQFLPVTGIDAIPSIRMFTVSDLLGEGAALAEFQLDPSLDIIATHLSLGAGL